MTAPTYINLMRAQQKPWHPEPVVAAVSTEQILAAGRAARRRLMGVQVKRVRDVLHLAPPAPPERSAPAETAEPPAEMVDQVETPVVEEPEAPMMLISTAERIFKEVCTKHGITKAELLSPRRERKLAAARQEACWRMSKETTLSLPAMGRKLGNRDHTTILHSIRRHDAALRGEVYIPAKRKAAAQ